MSTYYIKTFGCQMNEYDSSQLGNLLETNHGYSRVEAPEDADLILVNTCSIREKAEEKVFGMLGRYRKLKEKKPSLLIGVCGCVASQEGKKIAQRAPYVDLIFGPQTIHRLPELLQKKQTQKKAVIDISFPEIEKFDCLPEPKVNGAKAYLSIMEGCSKYCAYCIVPFTRGEEISRPFDDVLSEAFVLAEQGVKEITLLGQNVNAYRGTQENGGIADLALAIHYIGAIEGVERIRFTTSHPMEFSQSLIDAYAQVPQLANHLHLPVQSGSDHVLQLMKRNHTAIEFLSKINRLKKIRPDITLSSDFIVGFPGERECDFEDTMQLVQKVGFDTSYSFIYSPRPGTPAASLPDDISMETKKQRLKALQDLIKSNAQDISEKMLGTQQRILIDGEAKKHKNEISGRTENNRVVNLGGSTDLIGQMVDVKIVDVKPNSLRGELI